MRDLSAMTSSPELEVVEHHHLSASCRTAWSSSDPLDNDNVASSPEEPAPRYHSNSDGDAEGSCHSSPPPMHPNGCCHGDTVTIGGDNAGNTGVPLGMLELRSVKPYKTQDEYLYAMREDLAEWFNGLYDLHMTCDNFFDMLDTGLVLCQHANNVREFMARWLEQRRAAAPAAASAATAAGDRQYPSSSPASHPADDGEAVALVALQKKVTFTTKVKAGSFQARDNLVNFLTWCRLIGVPEVLLFETSDLVLRKNERNVILCLLEIARRGVRYGVPAPTLVQMEAEIDRELNEMQQDEAGTAAGDGEEEAVELHGSLEVHRRQAAAASSSRIAKRTSLTSQASASLHQGQGQGHANRSREYGEDKANGSLVQKVYNDLMSLDEMVRALISRCTCPEQFPMVKVGEGKYMIGESLTLIFVRILRNHVMVRIGGGWDTLENYLDRHDPCRCKTQGDHKGGRTIGSASKQTRRRSTPTLPSPTLYKKVKVPSNSFAEPSTSSLNQSASHFQRANSEGRSASGSDESPVNQPIFSDVIDAGRLPSSSSGDTSFLSPDCPVTRISSPKSQTAPPSPQFSEPPSPVRLKSVLKTSVPPSAQPGRPQTLAPNRKETSASGAGSSSAKRSLNMSRDHPSSSSISSCSQKVSQSSAGRNVRSKSVDLSRSGASLQLTSSTNKNPDKIMINRNAAGRHNVDLFGARGQGQLPASSSSGRQASVDTSSSLTNKSALNASLSLAPVGNHSNVLLPDKLRLTRPEDRDTMELVTMATEDENELMNNVPAAAAPPADEDLNRRMEELFEEYRCEELGLNLALPAAAAPVTSNITNNNSSRRLSAISASSKQADATARRYSLDFSRQASGGLKLPNSGLNGDRMTLTSTSVMTSRSRAAPPPRTQIQPKTTSNNSSSKVKVDATASKTPKTGPITTNGRRLSTSSTNLGAATKPASASSSAASTASRRQASPADARLTNATRSRSKSIDLSQSAKMSLIGEGPTSMTSSTANNKNTSSVERNRRRSATPVRVSAAAAASTTSLTLATSSSVASLSRQSSTSDVNGNVDQLSEGGMIDSRGRSQTPRPRKDFRRDQFPTRIPAPSFINLNSSFSSLSADKDAQVASLKRCDSGVDINVM